jgi:hypothetical protein
MGSLRFAANILAAGAGLALLFLIFSAAAVQFLAPALAGVSHPLTALMLRVGAMVLVEEACRAVGARVFAARMGVAAFAAGSGLIGVMEQSMDLLVVRASPHLAAPSILYMAAPVIVHTANGALLMSAVKGRMGSWAAFAIASLIHLLHNVQAKLLEPGGLQSLLWAGLLLTGFSAMLVLFVRRASRSDLRSSGRDPARGRSSRPA